MFPCCEGDTWDPSLKVCYLSGSGSWWQQGSETALTILILSHIRDQMGYLIPAVCSLSLIRGKWTAACCTSSVWVLMCEHRVKVRGATLQRELSQALLLVIFVFLAFVKLMNMDEGQKVAWPVNQEHLFIIGCFFTSEVQYRVSITANHAFHGTILFSLVNSVVVKTTWTETKTRPRPKCAKTETRPRLKGVETKSRPRSLKDFALISRRP